MERHIDLFLFLLFSFRCRFSFVSERDEVNVCRGHSWNTSIVVYTKTRPTCSASIDHSTENCMLDVDSKHSKAVTNYPEQYFPDILEFNVID